MNEFWERVTEGIDEKFINEAVALHIKKMPQESILIPEKVEIPSVSRRTLIIRAALKAAAVLAVVIGIGGVLRLNDVSVFKAVFTPDSGVVTDIDEVLDTEMPEPFNLAENSGSDDNSFFYLPCSRVLDNIPVELLRLREEDKVNEWLTSFDVIKNPPDSIEKYPNIYSFITAFNISDSELGEALSYYLNSTDEQIKISDEQLDTILTRDVERITEYFASEYSVIKGDKLYCPNWIYWHTADDYEKAGIIPRDIIQKEELYRSFGFSEEAAAAFEKKLSDFTETEIDIRQIPDASGLSDNEFNLLGAYYKSDDGLFHISDENWEISQDFELFRKYFFGVWDDGFVIDDSETSFLVKNKGRFFIDFYEIGDNVLAFRYGGFAGGEVYWLNTDNPDIMYRADGTPGASPNGFLCGEDGEPIIGTLEKTDLEINEPENGYLSVYRLREIAVNYGIDFSTLTDFGVQTENGTQYHDSKYYFYPVYLVAESDNRLEFKTKTGNTGTVYWGEEQAVVSVIFEKINGDWIRTVECL